MRTAPKGRTLAANVKKAVAIEAFNDVLKKHGGRPVVRNPLLE